jgi:Tfp pilus assembly protein PilP
MKEKKTIILAVILLALVGVYVWYSQKIDKEAAPKVDISKLDERAVLKGKVMKAVRLYRRDKGQVPRTLDELKGKYLDNPTYAEVKRSDLHYVYIDAKSYRVTMGEAGPVKLAAKKSDTEGKAADKKSTTPLTSEEVLTTDTGWKYDPTGKPDPFKAFILASAATEEIPNVVRRQLTPLQKMPLSEIQAGLKAIIWGQLGNKALVEDATGKGYVVQEGTYVGQHDGIVKKIYQDRIIVEEYRRDPAKGKLEPTEVVLKLKKVEAEE